MAEHPSQVDPSRCRWCGTAADRRCGTCQYPACGGHEAPTSHDCDGPPE